MAGIIRTGRLSNRDPQIAALETGQTLIFQTDNMRSFRHAQTLIPSNLLHYPDRRYHHEADDLNFTYELRRIV